MNAAPLMISVAGVRGIIGATLTPPVLSRFAAAFVAGLGPGPIVIGRDARVSGPMVHRAVAAGAMAAGRDVVDLGLATTPTTQLAVERLQAAGGIILTASHNPAPWNALKFLSARGEFLDSPTGQAVRARYESGTDAWVRFDRLGTERVESDALDWHVERVLGLDVVEVPAIRARRLKVVVDGCASVGGIAAPRLLRDLGADVVELDCVPDGRFTRELEPLAEHLGRLCDRVRVERADFGVALDPDADRAAFVDAGGRPLGEEYTVALGTTIVLAKRRGPVVTNLSTSRMLDAVCARAGVALHRTLVGEAHVVSAMHAVGAVAGGEGNGGMILPAAHHGRDGLVAIALVAQAMTANGATLRSLADALPRFVMVKEKVERGAEPWESAAERLLRAFDGYEVNREDGLRFARAETWVHVRSSGTEPVVRIIAESPTEEETRRLVAHARGAISPNA
ncbi:MAG: phosphoglucosamine mutase [Candidatus Eisenbacteria bacterium]|uniref:Phosphoglucosamine mutase n=1 Tax=Eiseniibacteriota bacterium TaxID=2212470 RepID=A0A849SGV6_UNCEI|nr:phosphoglucosamine mutase [Candidatus Eisenbacteria bacterium]